ncbi:MAG: class I SAM-dependent methyltransferase, partial [bacterium]
MEEPSVGKSQFDVRKPEYLETYDHFKDPASFKQIAKIVEKHLGQKDRSSVRCLDSMAGTGLVGRNMQKLFPGIKVVYQDGSKHMLSSDAYGESDERVLSDATAMSLNDKSFDIVFCRAGLNNVKEADYPRIIAEQLRVLNDDGIIILMDHFAQTEEERNVINQIENEVKRIEGIIDEVHVPTIENLRGLIEGVGGRVSDEQLSMVPFSMKKRFASKGIEKQDLSTFSKILKAQNVLTFQETEDDIVITYPIATIAF